MMSYDIIYKQSCSLAVFCKKILPETNNQFAPETLGLLEVAALAGILTLGARQLGTLVTKGVSQEVP